jgi:hypothetical protein
MCSGAPFLPSFGRSGSVAVAFVLALAFALALNFETLKL